MDTYYKRKLKKICWQFQSLQTAHRLVLDFPKTAVTETSEAFVHGLSQICCQQLKSPIFTTISIRLRWYELLRPKIWAGLPCWQIEFKSIRNWKLFKIYWIKIRWSKRGLNIYLEKRSFWLRTKYVYGRKRRFQKYHLRKIEIPFWSKWKCHVLKEVARLQKSARSGSLRHSDYLKS